MGLTVGLEHDGNCQGVTKKAGRYPLTRLVLLSRFAAGAGFRHPSDQVEDKTPTALALATACVRLRTPSLRANSDYLRGKSPNFWERPIAWVRLCTSSLP
jgi:hypothetical protein